MVVSILKAEHESAYKIKFYFSDDTSRVVDFEDFLSKSRNPMTRKYLDVDVFKGFYLEHGDIVWNDYELCFPIWDLYEGRI
jgi:hypothetical protein